ncbi:MAG: SufD family Fe-S cluster assembly protein [Akkermansia sp.]
MNVQDFLQQTGCLSEDWPQWFLDLYERTRLEWMDAPIPHKSDEMWRFGHPSMLHVAENIPYPELPDDELEDMVRSLPPASATSYRIVVINGRLIGEPCILPDGLMVQSLSEYIRTEPTAQVSLETPFESLGMRRFVLLRCLLGGEGLVIRTCPNIVVDKPIEIIHLVAGDRTLIAPMTLIAPGENARVDILEHHWGVDHGESVILSVQHLLLASGSSVRYALLQQLNEHSRAIELADAVLGANAQLEHLSVHQGALWSRQELMCRLEGRGAQAQLLSAASLDGSRELDQRTYQQHSCPGTRSNLLYKNVLNDSSKSTFSGMIRVDSGAHETDSYQSNLNLLMSERAEANSMPGLEILADGVQCSHGTAVSPIDPEQIFYLQSRGIPLATAKKMIATGFLRQPMELFTCNEITELLKAKL